jgi:hypothetical protein
MSRLIDGVYSKVDITRVYWACNYDVARSGFRINSHIPPTEVSYNSSIELTDKKGKRISCSQLFTTEELCQDHYRELVGNHIRDLGFMVDYVATVATKAIKRCPTVVNTQDHRDLIDSLHKAADTIK